MGESSAWADFVFSNEGQMLYPAGLFWIYYLCSHDKVKATVDDVPIMREYSDVFLEDFPGVPPER